MLVRPQSQTAAGMGPYSRANYGAGLMPAGEAMQQYQQRVSAQPIQPVSRPQATAPREKKDSGGMSGMMGGMMSGMLSDERSKTEIARLEGQNEALTKALGAHVEYPTTREPESDSLGTGRLDGAAMAASQGNLPPTEYPRLPSNTRFANSPAANTVAAQNVGLQGGAPAAPVPMQRPPVPQAAQGFARPNLTAPDMSELDRAYARMGQGG